MQALLTIGVSASGKTTYAREMAQQGWGVVSRDDIRWVMMTERNLTPSWKNWNWKWEDEVTQRFWLLVEEYAREGRSIVIADTNLQGAHREVMKKRLTDLGFEVSEKVFPVTYDEAVRRDTERAHGVGPWTIAKQWERFNADHGEGRVVPRPDLPRAAIVDIDGTVALMNGNRSPYDWDRVGEDDPHEVVWAMVAGLDAAGYTILFVSGRDGKCYEQTMEWILRHGAEYIPGRPFGFWMRPEGDMRPDTIIKREIFDAHIRDKWDVRVVLDDRPKVARMWRDLGLNVVQVGNPYVDF